MPTTAQKPQPMFPPFLSVERAHHDGSRDLVVPALLAFVEGDPEEAYASRKDRDEIRQVAPDQPAGGRLRQGVGGDDLCTDKHLSRGGPAETPEKYHRN